MIKLNVSAANIAVEEKETLTEGRMGLLCRFSFTGEWDGLAKTAVFDGADSRDVILTEDTVAVPAECLAAEGYSLSVGVYGKNTAGDIVIPTVYATVGKIQRSAYPSGKETAAPTPDVVAQIQQAGRIGVHPAGGGRPRRANDLARRFRRGTNVIDHATLQGEGQGLSPVQTLHHPLVSRVPGGVHRAAEVHHVPCPQGFQFFFVNRGFQSVFHGYSPFVRST